MRSLPNRPAPAGSTPLALRGKASLRAVLTTAVAAAIGFAPVVMIASPAAAAQGTISFVAATANVAEGSPATVTLRRTGDGTAQTADNLTWSTTDGTATQNLDYTPRSNVAVAFAAGSPPAAETIDLVIPTLQDTLDEVDETFTVTATGTGVNVSATVTILDDDAAPGYTLSVVPTTVSDGGVTPTSRTATVTATLGAASGKAVGVTLNTANGTAVSGVSPVGDYTALTNQVLNFAPGETVKTHDVVITRDGVKDSLATETFAVNGTGTNVAIAAQTTSVSITDADATPVVSLTAGGGPVAEGANSTFTVSVDHGSELPITVHWDAVASAAVTGHNAATPSSDFTTYPASADRTVTIPAGSTSAVITVPIKLDTLDELPEDFDVEISAPTNSTLGTPAKLTATISDSGSDLPPVVAITPVAVTEGDAGTTARTFTATLAAASGRTVKVDWSTAIDGSIALGKAVPGRDFLTNYGTLTFPAGTTTQTFTVDVIGDKIDEQAGETFLINLSDVDSSATISTPSTTVTITDDDATPTFTVDDVVYKEGDSVSVTLLAVKLSGASDRAVAFDVSNMPITGDTAQEAVTQYYGSNDFDNPISPITVPSEQTTGYGIVYVNGDEIYEANETTHFDVATAGGSSAYVSGALKSPKLTLTNDDLAPVLKINDVTGNEGETVKVTGTVSGMAQDTVTLNVTFAGGSRGGSVAADANDFTNPGASAVYIYGGTEPGTVEAVADVILTNDTVKETAETILVNGVGLGNVGTVTQGAVTIAASDGATDPEEPPTGDEPTINVAAFRLGAGDLDVTGTVAPGATVEFWAAPVGGGDLVMVDETEADGSGDYLFTATFEDSGLRFQVKSGGVLSVEKTVWLKQDPRMTSVSGSKRAVTLRTFGDPLLEGQTVVVQRYVDGEWVKVGTGSTNAEGKYVRTFTNLPSRVGVTHRAYIVGDTGKGIMGNYTTFSRVIVR